MQGLGSREGRTRGGPRGWETRLGRRAERRWGARALRTAGARARGRKGQARLDGWRWLAGEPARPTFRDMMLGLPKTRYQQFGLHHVVFALFHVPIRAREDSPAPFACGAVTAFAATLGLSFGKGDSEPLTPHERCSSSRNYRKPGQTPLEVAGRPLIARLRNVGPCLTRHSRPPRARSQRGGSHRYPHASVVGHTYALSSRALTSASAHTSAHY